MGERKAGPLGTPTPAPRIVSAPPRHDGNEVPARPPSGRARSSAPYPIALRPSRLRSHPRFVRWHHRRARRRWLPRHRVCLRRRPLPRHHLRLRAVGLRSRRWWLPSSPACASVAGRSRDSVSAPGPVGLTGRSKWLLRHRRRPRRPLPRQRLAPPPGRPDKPQVAAPSPAAPRRRAAPATAPPPSGPSA